jgi:hypothetical protein
VFLTLKIPTCHFKAYSPSVLIGIIDIAVVLKTKNQADGFLLSVSAEEA